MFKTILVALDGSATSNAGLRSALELASDQQAKLVGLHVIDDASMAVNLEGGYLPASYIDTLYDSLRKSGQAILTKAQATARAAGVEITPILVESRGQTVAQAILQQARKSKADAIVIGTHGRRGVARILMGSDAEQVLREARVPVLIVRSPVRAKRRKVAQKRAPSARPARIRTAGTQAPRAPVA
jgi:nucleotide-binding universal stress UspA family protein